MCYVWLNLCGAVANFLTRQLITFKQQNQLLHILVTFTFSASVKRVWDKWNKRYLMSIMKKSYSAFNLLFLRRNKSAWMEDYTTLSSYFYLKSFSFHQNSDSQTNLFEYMSNHQSSSNTPSQLSLLCKTFKSPELQQAEVNLIMITCRHLPYLDSVSLIFSTTFPSVTPKKMTTTLFR